MQGAENIMQLAITQAHEKVVAALEESGIEYRIVRPCGILLRHGRGPGYGQERVGPI